MLLPITHPGCEMENECWDPNWCLYKFAEASASLGFNVHYHAQSHCHKQLSYLLKSSHKIENYAMCKLSAGLFGFAVIFNLDSVFYFFFQTNLEAVVKYKLGKNWGEQDETAVNQKQQKL